MKQNPISSNLFFLKDPESFMSDKSLVRLRIFYLEILNIFYIKYNLELD